MAGVFRGAGASVSEPGLARRRSSGKACQDPAAQHFVRREVRSRARKRLWSAFAAKLRADDSGRRAWVAAFIKIRSGRPRRLRLHRQRRPRDDTGLQLISFLAVDWTLATQRRPVPGRSDQTPFGDLVHQVFGWLELPDATGALRRYWRVEAKSRTATFPTFRLDLTQPI